MNHSPAVLDELPSSLAVSETVRDLIDVSVSENTRRAYRYALKKFGDHLAGGSGHRPNHLRISRPVARGRQISADLLPGGGRDPVCGQAARDGLAHRPGDQPGPYRDPAHGPGPRAGAGPGRDLGTGAAVSFAATGGSLADVRDAAIIAVASDAMLRASEVAALQVADISYEPDGTGTVTIRSSKTGQEGRGSVQFLGASTAKRIKAWLEKAGIREGPLFRRVFVKGSRVGDRKLNVTSVREIIKERCAAIGIEGQVSGHSLRVGGAQSLAAGGGFLAGNADRRALGIAADAGH